MEQQEPEKLLLVRCHFLLVVEASCELRPVPVDKSAVAGRTLEPSGPVGPVGLVELVSVAVAEKPSNVSMEVEPGLCVVEEPVEELCRPILMRPESLK